MFHSDLNDKCAVILKCNAFLRVPVSTLKAVFLRQLIMVLSRENRGEKNTEDKHQLYFSRKGIKSI